MQIAILAIFLVTIVTILASGEREIKNWDAHIELNLSLNRDDKESDAVKLPGRNLDQTKTFSSQLRRDLESRRLPVRSSATIGGYVEQDLDHFDAQERRKWKQYFFYNTNNQKSPNDLNFLMLGGEGPIYESQVLDGALMMMIWAKSYGAAAYSLEHRFYGDSQPMPGNTSTANLKYLSSEQALADAAVFIQSINKKEKIQNPKWVVFGGSYPGNLAAWLREKYPDLVVGAVASSAPVRAKLDYFEYYQTVEKALDNFGTATCAQDTRSYFSQAQSFLQTSAGRKALGMCNKEVDSSQRSVRDAHYFIESQLSNNFGWNTQSDSLDHAKVIGACKWSKDMYDKATGNFKSENVAESEITASTTAPKNSSNDSSGCTDYSYDEYVKTVKDVAPTWYRSWLWQTCTEFGYYQTINPGHKIFGGASLPVKYSIDLCADVFDLNSSSVDSAIFNTNKFYGGSDHFNATNVVFINGSEDPWHPLSLYQSPTDSVKSILIEGKLKF
ncbi:serine carboxypeptidase s28 domain-containing protein [Ditylenchus destructor]|nr:serine carboxypeptidase s28 domain-containing protein [Ditylenchus destructor]